MTGKDKVSNMTSEQSKALENSDSKDSNRADTCYQEGLAYEASKEYDKAVDCYREACQLGSIPAHKELAAMYYNGKGVEKSVEEALPLFRKAAEAGDADSQLIIGYSYHTGIGVEQDYKEALRWYALASEKKNDQAQYYIGLMYYKGNGLEQDIDTALMWFNLSAAAGNTAAKEALEKIQKEQASQKLDYQSMDVKELMELSRKKDYMATYYLGRWALDFWNRHPKEDKWLSWGTKLICKAAAHGCEEAKTTRDLYMQ